MADLCRSNLYV